jgi:hypothetical protein
MLAAQHLHHNRTLLRIGLTLGYLAYAVLALGSGLDRMSRGQPDLAPLVPGIVAAQAQRSQALAALNAGNAVLALDAAEAAVAAAPLDPESPALLGMARLMAGNRAGAEPAFVVAGRLGWRVPSVQAYWLERALAAGDYRVAALRLDAMLRQQPALVDERRLLGPLERSQQGRAALAVRIVTGPGWLDAYTQRVNGLDKEALLLRALVLGEVARRGAAVGCDRAGPLVEALVAADGIAEAAALWRAHCPGASGSLVYDPQFAKAEIEQDRNQFAWTFIGHSDVSALLEPGPHSPARQVALESTATVPRLALRQLVLLGPGRYQLSWRSPAVDGAATPVLASLSCSPNGGAWLPASYDEGSERWASEVAIDAACRARWLGFGIAAQGKATLGEIALERVG